MAEVVVFATLRQADAARAMLTAACRETNLEPRLELLGNGSIFQRLTVRRARPFPDVIVWFGPYAAHSAAMAGLLEPHTPGELPPSVTHHPDWRWTAVDHQAFGISGEPPIGTVGELMAARSLALLDAERSEIGMALLLATLDRERQLAGAVESAWTWWAQRVAAGVRFVDEEVAALALVRAGRASHALTLSRDASPLLGLAPLPDAVALAADAPNPDAGRRLIDWALGASAPRTTRYSAWGAESNGLQQLLASAPPLDVAWGTAQYNAMRRRWTQSGFGPAVETT
jgi:hypothetical protein